MIKEKRLNKLRNYLKNNDSSLFITTIDEDIFYFTGFKGGGTLVYEGEKNKDILLTNYLYYETAVEESMVSEVRGLKLSENNQLKKIFKNYSRKKAVISEKENIKFYKLLKSCGLNLLEKNTGVLRSQKEDYEIELIKKSYRITEKTILKIINEIKEGVTEREIAAEFAYQIRSKGAQKESFEPIIVFGEKTSVPHAKTANKKLKKGDLILIDAGAKFKGYCSDITRCFVLGKANREIVKYYKLLKVASDAAIEKISEGERRTKEIDKAARSVLRKEGVDNNFVHGIGHGLGLNVHEYPKLGPNSEDIIKEEMVFTIEPGVYFEGKFGLRLEDCILLGEKPNYLTALSRSIIEL